MKSWNDTTEGGGSALTVEKNHIYTLPEEWTKLNNLSEQEEYCYNYNKQDHNEPSN